MERFLFTPLDTPQPRTTSFVAGWGVQLALIGIILGISAMTATTAIPAVSRSITAILVPYVAPVPQTPQPIVHFKTPVVVTQQHALIVPITPRRNTERPVPVEAPPQVAMEVAPTLPSMSTGSSAKPTLAKPTIKVQTGGFGDPNGVAAAVTSTAKPNIAAVGSFDLPEGGGKGNGHGGKIAGVTTSTGFGSGEATGNPTGRKVTVATSNFDNHTVVDDAKAPVAAQSPTTPAQIIGKVIPQYSEEGRKLKIQGAVRLQVRFTATGKVEVLNVISGLGHGLDEQAVRAAQLIQFKPAQREGQYTDTTVTLSIIFALAS